MSNGTLEQPSYTVRVDELADEPEVLAITFVPKSRPVGAVPQRVPQFTVLVRGSGKDMHFDWTQSPDNPGSAGAGLEADARQRVEARAAWTRLVADLVARVEQWGQELGWATKQIEKRLDDIYIGRHRVPALLMQEETFRVLLEPIGRDAPGSEAIVDLYLLPAYDDIASLYFYGGQWNIHYYFPSTPSTGDIRQTPSSPLTKDTLKSVLKEMRVHAA